MKREFLSAVEIVLIIAGLIVLGATDGGPNPATDAQIISCGLIGTCLLGAAVLIERRL